MIPDNTRFILIPFPVSPVVLTRALPTSEAWIIHIYDANINRSALTIGTFSHEDCLERVREALESEHKPIFVPYEGI